ncbi:uncharacterized protein [Fopius arisanus]|uniref:Su(Hw) protein n=1 Tax=Fopius arisanus TaxID=64838 RepID=A0A0C9R7E6_9HYME|nr:PREDICTED: uncharacterized protein LOC105266719 [Fopius arisanus]
MARAMIYRGSSSLLQVDPPADEVDPLELPIKLEPSSPEPETPADPEDRVRTPPPSTSLPSPRRDAPSPQEPPDYDSSASSLVHSQNPTKKPPKRSHKYGHSQKLAQFLLNNRSELQNSRLRTRSTHTPLFYECQVCYVQYNDRGALTRHMNQFKFGSKKRIVCHVCRISLATPHQLLSHRKSAHRHIAWPHSPYKCHHCPLTYTHKMPLQMHLFHYHDMENNEKLKKRRGVEQSVVSDNEIQPRRSARKRKRARLVRNRRDLCIPKATKPGPTSSKTGRSTQITKVIPSTNSTKPSTSAPFVQIHAVPQEVEALLSDYETSPMKRRRLDPQEVSMDVETRCLRSGRTVKIPVAESSDIQEPDPKTEPKQKRVSTPGRKASLPQTPKNGTPMVLATRKITLLQMKYNCRDCYVPLSRINVPEGLEVSETEMNQLEDTSSEMPHDVSSIDLQLKNLEIALKKLEAPDVLTDRPPGKIERLEIFRSSICRTRFTTKQKLINHYLCFHTNASQDECGVCRIRCGNYRKLKNHLLLHCVKIIQSKQDRSPIDPRGPCEKYRKKYFCTGCKKRFWLASCLAQHQSLCRLAPSYAPQENPQDIPQKNVHDNTRETAQDDTQENLQETPQEAHQEIPVPEVNEPIMTRRTSPRKHDKRVNLMQSPTIIQTAKTVKPAKTPKTPKSDAQKTHRQKNSSVRIEARSTQDSRKQSPGQGPVPEKRWWDTRVPYGVPAHPCSICNINFQAAAGLSRHVKMYNQRDFSRCEICGTLFPSRNLLYSHRKTAHCPEASDARIQCPVCEQAFAKKTGLRAHLLHVHHDQIIRNIDEFIEPTVGYEMKCKICKLIFQSRRRFIEHSMYYFDDETYSCHICDKKFWGKFRCHFHWKIEHYSKEMQQAYTHHCPVCSEGFMYQSHLHSHMFHVHDLASDSAINGGHSVNTEDPFVCATCEQRFASIVLLDQHQNLHSNDGKYQCDKCGRKCRSVSILEEHLRASHSNRVLPQGKCPICGEGISSKTSWISHIKHAHDNPTNQPSEFCLENVCTLNELIRDSGEDINLNRSGDQSSPGPDEDVVLLDEDDVGLPEVQTVNIEFNCAICDERFTSMLELKSHKITHGPVTYGYQPEENYQVPKISVNEVAPQPLETVNLPSIHPQDNSGYSYHTDKDPCNFSIANIYSVGLDEYEKLANNQPEENETIEPEDNAITENILKCEVCQLVFTCAKTLQNHLIRYSNTGDYICEVCGRRFKWSRVFRSHIRKHHKRRNNATPMYYCEQCDEAFATKNSKHMHFAHIHNDLNVRLTDDDMADIDGKTGRESPVERDEIQEGIDTKSVEEVDLTEDEEEASEPPTAKNLVPMNSVVPLSAAIKPTVAQARVQPTAHRPSQVAASICPIICNICHIQCRDVDYLVNHFETAHSIRLAPYKPSAQIPYNSSIQGECQSNQDSLKNHLAWQVNSKNDSDPSTLFYYCKTCRIQFANEYSLLTHLRNAHAKTESLPGKHDNWSNDGAHSGGHRENIVAKGQQSTGGVSIETSFISSERHRSAGDSAGDNAMDLTKKRNDAVVLSKIDLKGADRPYRILGGKNPQNIQFISLQRKDLVSLTRQRLQESKSPQGSSIR